MKRTFLIITLLMYAFTAHSYAATTEISTGLSLWFAKWSPMFEKTLLDLTGGNINSSEKKNYRMNPSYLIGPVFSIGFQQKWNFSTIFICGPHYSAVNSWPAYFYYQGAFIAYSRRSLDIRKYDLDSTLSYSIHPILNIFAGMKYQRYEYTGTSSRGTYQQSIASTTYTKKRYDVQSDGYGPGVGIGLTFRLVQNFFLLFNVSGLYLRTTIRSKQIDLSTTTYPYARQKGKLTFNVFGGNSNISFAFYIPKASTTISIGGRFQYLIHKSYATDIDIDYFDPSVSIPVSAQYSALISSVRSKSLKEYYNNNSDMFYGVMLSAVYSFQIQ